MGINMAAIAEVAWSTLSKKREEFDALPEEEKEQKFLSTIDEIKMSKDFQNFESWWNKLGVRKKKQFYNDWEVISVPWAINYASKAPWTLDVSLNPFKRPRVRWLPNPVTKHINPKKNIKESVETSIYEQFPWLMRIGVDFWLLKKPWTLSKKTLLKNIAADATTLDTNLKTFREACKYVKSPVFMAIGALIEKFLPYTTWYKDRWAELIQERIQNGNKRDVEKSTTYSLSHMEQSIVKSEVEWRNNPGWSNNPRWDNENPDNNSDNNPGNNPGNNSSNNPNESNNPWETENIATEAPQEVSTPSAETSQAA